MSKYNENFKSILEEIAPLLTKLSYTLAKKQWPGNYGWDVEEQGAVWKSEGDKHSSAHK